LRVLSQRHRGSYSVNYNCRNCSVVFATGAEAEAAGFKPAGDCLR